MSQYDDQYRNRGQYRSNQSYDEQQHQRDFGVSGQQSGYQHGAGRGSDGSMDRGSYGGGYPGQGGGYGGERNTGQERGNLGSQYSNESYQGSGMAGDYGDQRDGGRFSQRGADVGGYRGGYNSGSTYQERNRGDQAYRGDGGNTEGYGSGSFGGPGPGYQGQGGDYANRQSSQGSRGAHHDPDYHQWRTQQMNDLDRDYDAWRQERYQKFSDDFTSWRSNRSNTAGRASTEKTDVDSGLSSSQSAGTGSTSSLTSASAKDTKAK